MIFFLYVLAKIINDFPCHGVYSFELILEILSVFRTFLPASEGTNMLSRLTRRLQNFVPIRKNILGPRKLVGQPFI